MSRDSNGVYTLPPAVNPVVAGTVITDTWGNTTMDDVATALSDSLSRSGKGAMSAPLRLADGLVSAPSLTFINELTSGWYRAGAGDVRLSVLGVDRIVATATTITFSGLAALAAGSTVPTAAPGDNTTKIANTAFSAAAVLVETLRATTAEALLAPLASPTLTGSPRAPTAASGDASTLLANTQFVMAAAFNTALPAQSVATIGKFPQSDGANASWVAIPPPTGSTLFLASNFGAL